MITLRPPIRILVVDDNEADVDLIRESFEEIDVKHEIFSVNNGLDAIDFVLKHGKYEDAPDPHFIVLDLNLPICKGHEVLAAFDKHDILTPVIVYTTSDNPTDIEKAYELHANCYVVKPSDADDLLRVLKLLGNFWGAVAQLPQRRRKNR